MTSELFFCSKVFPFLHYSYLKSQDETLWACLAAMSAYAKELSTAEIAYAAIEEVIFNVSLNISKFYAYEFMLLFLISSQLLSSAISLFGCYRLMKYL